QVSRGTFVPVEIEAEYGDDRARQRLSFPVDREVRYAQTVQRRQHDDQQDQAGQDARTPTHVEAAQVDGRKSASAVERVTGDKESGDDEKEENRLVAVVGEGIEQRTRQPFLEPAALERD